MNVTSNDFVPFAAVAMQLSVGSPTMTQRSDVSTSLDMTDGVLDMTDGVLDMMESKALAP